MLKQGYIGNINDAWGTLHTGVVVVEDERDEFVEVYSPSFHEHLDISASKFKSTNQPEDEQTRLMNVEYANQHRIEYCERLGKPYPTAGFYKFKKVN